MSDNKIINNAENQEELELEVFTLVDEEGVESDFEFIGSLELEGNEYAAFSPITEEDDDSDELEYVIFKISIDEEGNEVYDSIDDDDEFDRVSDAFEDYLWSECDLDELDEDDE